MMTRANKGERALRLRIRIIQLLFAVFVCAIIFRAWQLNVNTNPRLKRWAKNEYEKFVVLSPQRGEIFDDGGNTLASSVTVKSIYANPRKIKDKAAAATKIAAVTGQNERSLLKRLKSDKHFVWIKRKASPSLYNKLKSLSVEGLGALDESKRFYPNVELASGVLGFTGLDSNGLSGVELKYDKYLRSEESRFKRLSDALGRELFTDGFFVREFSKGNNVYLTLNRAIQYLAEIHLDSAIESSGAKRGYVVAMDPKTGKILAMVSRPKFNPNSYKNSDPQNWTNGALSLVFEPGSTFKVFVAAAAMEEGLLKPDDVFYCREGSFTVANKSIRDSSDRGWLTPSAIIKHSSNIGAAKIALMLGRKKVYDWSRKWGFGEPTGVDLPGETKGILRDYAKWRELDVATAGFGQGIAVSAVQLTSALSSIANGGLKLKPYIVDRVEDPQGNIILKNDPVLGPRIISEHTAETLRNFMIGVTDDDGTGFRGRIEGFRVAGKTGTAQKIDAVTGEYSNEKIVVSFMGFAPADDPKIAVLVVLDEPLGKVFGGEIAAPVFGKIAREALVNMQVHPPVDFEGDFHFIEPPAAEKKVEFITASLDLPAGSFYEGLMPDFEGMSIRDVFKAAGSKGLEISIKGSGLAFKQDPEAGSRLDGNKKCTVYFRPI